MKRVLIYTDSRGQHVPKGETFEIYARRLALHPSLQAQALLCPLKWTTTVDFLDRFTMQDLASYDHVVLHTGIVDWSPRPALSAREELYDNPNPANEENYGLDTDNYARKVVNRKKEAYDRIFGAAEMAAHMQSAYETRYNDQPTLNMYSLEMAQRSLIPILAGIPNLIFINSNRFVPGWNGDYPRERPANIAITEDYSRAFTDALGPDRVIDTLAWTLDEVKHYTCDNLHVSAAGSEWILAALVDRLDLKKRSRGLLGRVLKSATPATPKVSIVVPIYNVERYLDECLQSIIRQTYRDIEVLLVDDGSTDAGAAVAKAYAERDPRFRYHWQENGGLGAARNTGISLATGEFVTFIDSDDYVSDDYIARYLEIQRQGDFDVVSGNFERISEEGKVLARLIQGPQVIPEKYQTLEAYQKVLGVYKPSISCARLYRRSVLVNEGLSFPGRMPHEDLCFTYKALFSAAAHGELPDHGYFYRQRGDSLSKAIGTSHVDALFIQLEDTAKFLKTQEIQDIDRFLAARRTTILFEGIGNRAKRAGGEVLDYLKRRLAEDSAALRDVVDYYAERSEGDTYDAGKVRAHFEDLGPPAETVQTEIQAVDASHAPVSAEPGIETELIFAAPNTNIYKYRRNEIVTDGEPTPALRGLFNKFKGERCFIIGNGPSLNRHDLNLLRNEYSFGVNSFYYKTRETGFTPTFFVVEDNMVMKDNVAEIVDYVAPHKFFPLDYKDLHPEADNVYFFRMNQGFYQANSPNYCVPRFSTDANDQIFCGQTVTYVNLQLAFYMGFTRVYLIGMDFDYVIPTAHERKGNHIISTTDDPNHFHKDYFGKGKTWKDPKLDRVAASYRQARTTYESVGRRIYNATIGGKLELFERADYNSLFQTPASPGLSPAPKATPPAEPSKPVAVASPVPRAEPAAAPTAPVQAQPVPVPTAPVQAQPVSAPRPDSLAAFKGRHLGERCFILGNGPSLNRTDLSQLAGETVFACNGVDLLFDRIDWRPTYYVSVDSRVLPDRAETVKAMLAAHPGMTGFFPAQLTEHDGSGKTIDTRTLLGSPANARFFNERSNDPTRGVAGMFSFNADEGLVQPYTVAITMMQLAAWMGFSEIVLVGCDTEYVIPPSVQQEGPEVDGGRLQLTSTTDDDPNHFDPRYFGKDRRWHQPQVEKMIEHYGYARQALEQAGVRVVNATPGGRLEVFDRADFTALTEPSQAGRAAAGAPLDLVVVRPDAQGRRTLQGLEAGLPVMVLGEGLDFGQDLDPAYVMAARSDLMTHGGTLAALTGDRARIRSVLLSGAGARAASGDDKAINLDVIAPMLWPGLETEYLSASDLGLLWAQSMGFRRVALADGGNGVDSRVLARLRAEGMVIQCL